ncbi:hypothetical protein AVEN_168426-1 [Araneus ventricosus]|uniref:RNA-directed DNA polymerase from mobile element jockey n=1 Tax=Araneus ventricosus TaxID=182803 RepID=A0A4Y2JED6_ARAVE|nr:hypothetical protein AVEN_168426-1 [Araneus ventricosus]
MRPHVPTRYEKNSKILRIGCEKSSIFFLFALGSLIAPKSTLAIKHKLLLYKAIVRPVMLYGSPILGTTSIRNLRKLQVFQNQQLARIVNAPWYVRRKLIHQDLKIDPVLDFMKIISKKILRKITPDSQRIVAAPTIRPSRS